MRGALTASVLVLVKRGAPRGERVAEPGARLGRAVHHHHATLLVDQPRELKLVIVGEQHEGARQRLVQYCERRRVEECRAVVPWCVISVL